jgi:hypothetical protein
MVTERGLQSESLEALHRSQLLRWLIVVVASLAFLVVKVADGMRFKEFAGRAVS